MTKDLAMILYSVQIPAADHLQRCLSKRKTALVTGRSLCANSLISSATRAKMKALVQRVRSASVTINGEMVSEIGPGMLILLGIHKSDTTNQLEWVARKCSALRIFADDAGKMNRSIIDVDQEILVVSQFTLYGSVERGNRPSFENAAKPDVAEPLYDEFVGHLNEIVGAPVQTGRFGAMMDVELINDGPVTIVVEQLSTV